MSSNNSPPALAPQYQPGPATYTRAPKGKACLNCRRRKLKCDCAHPVCSQCVRFGREKDCEYSEKDQKTRTEILEEDIAVLRARILELEGAASGRSSAGQVNELTAWPGLPDDFDFGDLASASDISGHSSGSHGSSPGQTTRSLSDPTYSEAQALIDAFLPYAHEVGFFLSTARFLSWASQQLPSVLNPYTSYRASDSSDPLLSVIYVWGAALSSDEDLKARQSTYLSRALRQVSDLGQNSVSALNTPAPRTNTLHIIQSHVLLANYFYNAGEFAEGRRHTADAVSLVLLHQLHKIRSPRPRDRSKMGLLHAAGVELAMRPPADLVEEGERTHAFWQVFILDKTWAALLGCPSLLTEDGSPGAEIDTPWPLAIEQYQDGTLPPGYGNAGQTIQNFMSTHDVLSSSRLSPLGLRARAAALLYRASWYASTSSVGYPADHSIWERNLMSFEATDSLLEKFVLSLPSLQDARSQLPRDVYRHLAVTHCLARICVVQLHYPFYDDELKSAAKTMSACKAIIAAVEMVPESTLVHTDPLLPVLLTMPPHIITTEMLNVVASKVTFGKRPVMTCVGPEILAEHIDEAVDLLNTVNRDSRLTVLQLEAVNNIKAALVGTEYQRP